LRLRLTQTGHLLEGAYEERKPDGIQPIKGPPLRGTLNGRRVTFEERNEDVIQTMEGEFSETYSEFSGEITTVINLPEGASPEEPRRMLIRMVRIPEDDLRREGDFDARLAARTEELREIADALVRFASVNHFRYPVALDGLVPDYLADASLVESTKTRRFEYGGGVLPDGERIAEIKRRLGEVPLSREVLLDIERDLSGICASNTPNTRPVLIARYADPEQWLYVDGAGKVRVPPDPARAPFTQAPHEFADSPDKIYAMIESDQNHLKQLGLVLKMFQGEADGFLPGGWLTVYPDYFSDSEVLRSPWDPPGVVSYDLLFPAWHGDELLALLRELADSEAIEVRAYVSEPDIVARPRLEGLIPVVIGKRAAPARPGEQARRHVLFLDGHVEALLPDSWEIQVAPFLR
jgi:prepilin-type processing-associated H-X9-DG protein